MGITGLLPFLEKASRKTNVSEFSGCTVAVDAYCWLHKGAFACAEKLAMGENTDIHIRYCMKYVTMLLSRNIKPILVFDGRHLPAKADTESKRRDSRSMAKKRAAELLKLGKVDEARTYLRRCVDITHNMAMALMHECRKKQVDCVVAPYEADAQLAYLSVQGFAHLVISEDSDLVLFGCTKVLYKMDLEGSGTLVEASKLPLVMKTPIERYSFDKFRQMCILSGCDYLDSLPGIGLGKARQFVVATQDSDFANALKKLPSFFNKPMQVSDEYRSDFLKAEATFKHQFVYDTCKRKMLRLTDPHDEGTELELCCLAGEPLDEHVALQLAAGNLNPFTLEQLDCWDPDTPLRPQMQNGKKKTDRWSELPSHPSIWSPEYTRYLNDDRPWVKKKEKVEPIIAAPTTRPRNKVVNLVHRIVPETQDESLTIESLSNMYSVEPASKKNKQNLECPEGGTLKDSQNPLNKNITESQIETLPSPKKPSPILRSKFSSRNNMKNSSFSVLKRLSKFPRTVMNDEKVESKFFSSGDSGISDVPESMDVSVSSSQKENESDLDDSMTKNDLDQSNESLDIARERLAAKTETATTQREFKSVNPFKVATNKQKILGSNIGTDKNLAETISANLHKVSFDLNKSTATPEITSSDRNNSLDSALNSGANVETKLNNDKSPVFEKKSMLSQFYKTEIERLSRNPFKVKPSSEDSHTKVPTEDSFVDNTCRLDDVEMTSVSQKTVPSEWQSSGDCNANVTSNKVVKGMRNSCKVSGLKRTASLPNNQPTLLSKFGFQKKAVMKKT